jgi:crotonobetainyl-CoA:carnitine CoA-transferase CaiB-like acyl-CoA transferase
VAQQGVFSSIRVVELASVLAGPGVGQFFAELGAEVIKVENLATQGDVTRKWKVVGENPNNGVSAYFSSVNWGKKSIAIDLQNPHGLATLQDLVGKSDIVIASYKPGDAQKLGVDYESLKKINKGIIYGHITGYGLDDSRTGYDAVIQAEAGFMYLNGEPGGPSLKMPVALMDILAGHHLKEAILLAMINKMKSGNGAYVEVSLFQAAVASLANQATNWLMAGYLPQKMGSEHPNIAPYGNVFSTFDNHKIILAIGDDRQFTRFCNCIGLSYLVSDPRFKSNAERVQNRKVLIPHIQDRIKQMTKEEVLTILHKEGVPAGGVNNMQEVFESPLAKALLLKNDHQGKKNLGVRNFVPGNQFIFKDSHFLPPPEFNEHYHEILHLVLGYSDAKIKYLRQVKAVL